MKVWLIAALSAVLTTAAVWAEGADVRPIKDSNGTTLGVAVVCGDCQASAAGGKKRCHSGVEQGWMDGQPCGACLLKENAGWRFESPANLHFTGTLADAGGAPVKDRFVKLFVANGWTVRTKTTNEGTFRVMLGATDRSKPPATLVTDLGTQFDAPAGKDPNSNFAIYLLPASYRPCSAPVESAPPKAGKKGKNKGAKKP